MSGDPNKNKKGDNHAQHLKNKKKILEFLALNLQHKFNFEI